MPIATPEVYAQMLDTAKQQGFAFPAINVTSTQTLNAALKGFADAGSDGIVQISTGGAEYLSGSTVKDMVTGSLALAAYAREVAKKYPVNIALHTDHCPMDKLDGYMRPLVAISAERVQRGQEPLFQSHMWDGSAIDLDENGESISGTADRAWTGANADGTAVANTCGFWSLGDAVSMGGVGAPSVTTSAWSSAGTSKCSSSAHLYCIQTAL